MREPPGRAAVQLLIDEAWSLHGDGRYADGLRAAEQAARAADAVGDDGLAVKAVGAEAAMLQMLGDKAGALARHTRVIAASRDPTRAAALAAAGVDWDVARAYFNWSESAGYLPEMDAGDILGVLDEADAWLASTGHLPWRSATCYLRARVLDSIGRVEEALGHAEEGLALKLAHPGGPGYTLGTHRWHLGHLLLSVGRHDEARRAFQQVVDDPAADIYSRKVAEQGLSYCATAVGEPGAAVSHARRALELAEPMGDDILTTALAALTRALLAGGDVAAAGAAASRHLDAARRLGTDHRLYYALRDSADVALRQVDLDAAQALLAEARPLAEAIDRSRARHTLAEEIASRERQLSEARESAAPRAEGTTDG